MNGPDEKLRYTIPGPGSRYPASTGSANSALAQSPSPSEQESSANPAAAPRPTVRVIIADSQAIFRVGMGKVFAAEADILVVGQADSMNTLRAVLKQHPSDVLLLDWSMLAGHAEVVAELMKLSPQIRMIVQGAIQDETRVIELYRNGVRGTIPRSISPDLLVKCVRKIAAGETWIDNQSVTWLIDAYRTQATQGSAAKTAPRLSPKELSIISYISQGKRNKEIAHHIGTSEQVIKNYLRKIYDKLGVSDRLELALYCLHHDLQKTANGHSGKQGGLPARSSEF